jgi:magnesium-transporting ATPase (P-type)
MENAFARSTSEVLKHFGVSETQGLTDAQVQSSREKYGRNGKQKITLRRAKAKKDSI